MSTQARQVFFATCSLLGVILTWYFNLQYIQESGGFSPLDFIESTYATSASSSISNDLLIVVIVFLFWSYTEAKRLNMRYWWIYLILTFLIAIAFSFPLFMFMRERALEKYASELDDVDPRN